MKLKDPKIIPVNYSFDATSLTDYEARFTLDVSGKVFDKVFNEAIKHTKHEKNIDTSLIEKFDVPEKFYGTMHLGIDRPYKDMKREVAEDGIIVNNSRVKKAVFERHNNVWTIIITTTGTYQKVN